MPFRDVSGDKLQYTKNYLFCRSIYHLGQMFLHTVFKEHTVYTRARLNYAGLLDLVVDIDAFCYVFWTLFEIKLPVNVCNSQIALD